MDESVREKVIRVPGPLVQDVEAIIAVYRHSKTLAAAREHLRKTLGQQISKEVA